MKIRLVIPWHTSHRMLVIKQKVKNKASSFTKKKRPDTKINGNNKKTTIPFGVTKKLESMQILALTDCYLIVHRI